MNCCKDCDYWEEKGTCKVPAIFPKSAYSVAPGFRRVMRAEDCGYCALFVLKAELREKEKEKKCE